MPAEPLDESENDPTGALAARLAAEVAQLRAEVANLKDRLAQAERDADLDPLVPVLNRRAFVRELRRAIVFRERYGGEGAVVFFDLDGFKAVNDRHGHATGDAALRTVGEVLVSQVRSSDAVGRLGGDEFVVLLARASGEAAAAKAKALEAAIRARPLRTETGAQITLNASWGLRTLESATDPEQVLADADAAMYLAKADRKR